MLTLGYNIHLYSTYSTGCDVIFSFLFEEANLVIWALAHKLRTVVFDSLLTVDYLIYLFWSKCDSNLFGINNKSLKAGIHITDTVDGLILVSLYSLN